MDATPLQDPRAIRQLVSDYPTLINEVATAPIWLSLFLCATGVGTGAVGDGDMGTKGLVFAGGIIASVLLWKHLRRRFGLIAPAPSRGLEFFVAASILVAVLVIHHYAPLPFEPSSMVLAGLCVARACLRWPRLAYWLAVAVPIAAASFIRPGSLPGGPYFYPSGITGLAFAIGAALDYRTLSRLMSSARLTASLPGPLHG